ncbi:hypothetical protein [Sinorhizobium medicae]
MKYTDENLPTELSAEPVRAKGAEPLVLEEAAYAAELSGFDMTDEQKSELLGILWSIMSGMVELGFTHDVCGQIFDGFESSPSLAPADVDLDSLEAR